MHRRASDDSGVLLPVWRVSEAASWWLLDKAPLHLHAGRHLCSGLVHHVEHEHVSRHSALPASECRSARLSKQWPSGLSAIQDHSGRPRGASVTRHAQEDRGVMEERLGNLEASRWRYHGICSTATMVVRSVDMVLGSKPANDWPAVDGRDGRCVMAYAQDLGAMRR